MTELARFPLEGGGDVVVEVGPAAPGTARVGRREDVLADARESFETALASVRDAAAAALGQFRDMTRAPDEVEIKFGVKLSAEAGAVIAKTGVEGQLEIKLKWRRDGEV
ncbi:CU044_2847 family protein [Amycolatopsis rhabdoformis]|uniref:CU044_2847 family protein n=1 Tax=Amycolatopsis rhabdoformis TaxID=1448059 RepID=A0ABZ1IJ37_9PSEU|nr:CU044_2847 family protein [Amycolatopsis rhabdoformis]WSE34026.1 CU044_2847 family protein [Amycolatopsis rhabdoformis]